MSKHTPGPWLISRYAKIHPLANRVADVYVLDERSGNAGENICKMSLDFDDEETEANAHLIAAAPQMLEALEYAKNMIAEIAPDHDGPGSVIDKAIRAAKGEV